MTSSFVRPSTFISSLICFGVAAAEDTKICNYSDIPNTWQNKQKWLRYSQSAPPSCWRACKKRLCKSWDQHLRCFLCPSFRFFSGVGSPALELAAATLVEEGVLHNDSVAFAALSSLWNGWKAPPPLPLLFNSIPGTFLAASWTICQENCIHTKWKNSQFNSSISSKQSTKLTQTMSNSQLSFSLLTSSDGGSGFHNWTDLSQSDFLLSLLVLFSFKSLCLGECCSLSSSSSSQHGDDDDALFLIGMNSSKTGPSDDVVRSEHSDWPIKLYSLVVPDNCCLQAAMAANIIKARKPRNQNPLRKQTQKIKEETL